MTNIRKLILSGILLHYACLSISQNSVMLKASFDMENGDYQTAYHSLKEVDVSDSEQAHYFELLGKAACESGNIDESMRAWLLRSELPNPSMAWFELARTNFLSGYPEEGYLYLGKYMQSDFRLSYLEIQANEAFSDFVEDRQWIRFWSGDWYSKKEDLINDAKAELEKDFPVSDVFENLEREFSDDPEACITLVRYYEKSGNLRKAKMLCERTTIQNDLPVALLNQAVDFYFRNSDDAIANELINRSLSINPYQPEMWLAGIELDTKGFNGQSSSQRLSYLSRIGIENQQLWMTMARESQQESPLKAIEWVTKSLGLNPLDTSALYLRAVLYQQTGMMDKAIIDLTQSLDADPFQPKVYFIRAEIRHQQGDQEGACHDWKKAFQYGHRKALDRLHTHCNY